MAPSDQTTFTSNVTAADTRHKFERLLSKFQTLDDPIERYIKRQEMVKIKRILEEEFGEIVEVP